MKNLKIFFLLFLANLTLVLNAQINYDEIEYKELTPIQIDTLAEPILVINKRYATIYLKQTDIRQYIESNKRSWSDNLTNVISLLSTKNTKYTITDWWYDYDDEQRVRIFNDKDYKNQDWYYLKELYYVVPDLVHDGKFMIKSKKEGKIVTDKLCIKKKEGFYGTEYVEFLLPDGKAFWTIVTALGE